MLCDVSYWWLVAYNWRYVVVVPIGTWRAVMFPSVWKGSSILPLTPRPLTRMRTNRKDLTACRCLKVCLTTSVLLPKKGKQTPIVTSSCGLSLEVSITCSLFSLAEPALLKNLLHQSSLSALEDHDKKSSDAATVGTSLPLSVPNKPESVMSITSQCSYSSTIVHVGDKKPQPDSGP